MILNNSVYNPTCLEYLPEVYSNIEEVQALANAYNLELKEINLELEGCFNNFFFETLNEEGCERWEKILNIKLNSSYTLEDRRLNIAVKQLGLLPYTYTHLKSILTDLMGDGNFLLELKAVKHKEGINGWHPYLLCKLDLGIKNQYNTIKELLENIVPLNVELDVTLFRNTHKQLSAYTHKELSKYTHHQLREEIL